MKNALGRLTALLCLPALTLVSTASVAHAAEPQQYVVPNQSINSELTMPGTVKDIKIQAVSNGREENKVDTPSGIQLEWQIESPEDDHQRSYEIEADGEVELSIDQSSGALLVKVDGVNAALINSPWAHDKNGQSLPTLYEVEGNVFTQVVETKWIGRLISNYRGSSCQLGHSQRTRLLQQRRNAQNGCRYRCRCCYLPILGFGAPTVRRSSRCLVGTKHGKCYGLGNSSNSAR